MYSIILNLFYFIIFFAAFPNFDPWAISYTLNATQKEKLENDSCTSYSRILTKYTPDKRVIRSWEWEPELLDELLEPDFLEELLEQKLLSNDTCMVSKEKEI